MLANSVIVPATIAYLGWMVVPDDLARLRWWMAGSVAFGLGLAGMAQVGFGLVVDRTFGYRDLVATTGLSRSGYLLAYALEGLTLALLPLFVVAASFLLPDVAPPAAPTWLVPFFLIAASFCALGMIFGATANSMPAVSMLANVAVVACVAFRPVSHPVERVPELIRPAVAVLPPSLAAELMAGHWDGGTLLDTRLAALAAWCAGLAALAWRLVPWTDRA